MPSPERKNNMSSAANHRRRSHRSSKKHYDASMRRYRINLARDLNKAAFADTFFGKMIRRFRTGTPEGK